MTKGIVFMPFLKKRMFKGWPPMGTEDQPCDWSRENVKE